jgi:hypothetical protein
MNTSQTPELLTEILEGKPIPVDKLAYFRRRLRLQLHDLVLRTFHQQETLTKAELARRIGRAPEVVNRLLGGPGNWTLDTVSDLLIGMAVLPLFNTIGVSRSLTSEVEQNQFAQLAALRAGPADSMKAEANNAPMIPVPRGAGQATQGGSYFTVRP